MQITGIILAGGKSKRMGTDKTLLKLNGVSLLERTIQNLQPVCTSLLISSNNPKHKSFGHKIVPDELQDGGPIIGIYSCLKKSETDWNFVLSADAPFLEKEFIQHLISQTGKFDAIVPIHKKGNEPLIALYNKSSLPVIEKRIHSGNFKMYDLVEHLNTKFINAETWLEKYPKLFHNINRPEDLT